MAYSRVASIPCAVDQDRRRAEFERLAIELGPALLAFARQLCYPDEALAQDLVQESLARGYRLLLQGKVEFGVAAFGWFTTVIRHEFYADARRQTPLSTMDSDQVLTSPAPGPEAVFLLEARRSQLLNAVSNLADGQRECVQLVDLGGMTYEEAARQLHVAVGTIKSRLARARLRLASLFVEE